MNSGASGVVYGRNVVQHPNPAKFIKSIRAIVHQNSSVADAVKILDK
jgi:DhnA family fructose-bisphosphate aldolase class Ia